MPAKQDIRIGSLRKSELGEAGRIVRVAFGTFLGLPDPGAFMDDRDMMTPRWRSPNVKVIAARDGSRLIGSNVVTRWGSFGYFGPLTVLPEYWESGVGQRLLAATMKVFDDWGVRHTGLYTFAASPKHVHLYQKFGYWPRYLTAILMRTPKQKNYDTPTLLSTLSKPQREKAIAACRKLTHAIDKGLDLSDEIRAVLAQRTGDIVLAGSVLNPDAFAICFNGPGSEGGSKNVYVKFAAARGGAGAEKRFDRVLDAIDAFAASRGALVEAGVNFAREGAYRTLRAHGYRVATQGVAMQRPHGPGFNHPEAWVIDDWR